jgi:hypothetical protein
MEKNNRPKSNEAIDAIKPSEAPEDFESRPELAALIEQLRAEPAAQPQADFTRRVMEFVSEVQAEMTGAAAAAERMRKRAASLMRYLTDTPSVADIALCFLLAGFFYLLVAVIFFFGLQNMQPLPASAGWLRLQPQVAMLTAAVLAALGLLLMIKGGMAMRLAQIGTLVFIGFSVFNGMWLGRMSAGGLSPAGLLCFTAAPVLLGLFLAASLQRYHRRAVAG